MWASSTRIVAISFLVVAALLTFFRAATRACVLRGTILARDFF